MDVSVQKQLLDRAYEKRKLATIELEKQVLNLLSIGDHARINLIVAQLCALLVNASPNNINARNGGLIGLAGLSIALGPEIAIYLEQIVPPILSCFVDPDSKIRYFACESFYNVAKVCKGEILVFFNEIFDALSKLAADSDVTVRNGAELFDRLLKDIVAEAAPHYISHAQNIEHIRAQQDARDGVIGGDAELDVAREKARFSQAHNHELGSDAAHREAADRQLNKAFSLARFVPLLAERIYVLSPFTRNFLVSWITVLDSVPQLELVSYLPSFFDGLLKYLSDPNTDVRVATANVLADFLNEIKEAAERRQAQVQREQEQQRLIREEQEARAAEARAREAQRAAAAQQVPAVPPSGLSRLVKPVAKRKALSPTRATATGTPSTAATPALPSGELRPDQSAEAAASPSKESELQQAVASEGHESADLTASDTAHEGAAQADAESKAEETQEEGDDEEDDLDEVPEEPIEEPLVESWEPGFVVRIDYGAIMEILLEHAVYPGESLVCLRCRGIQVQIIIAHTHRYAITDEDRQATALHWISELLSVVQDVIVPFTPRLLPTILPLIAHHSAAIQAAANATNVSLYRVIQHLASPAQPPPPAPPSRPMSSAAPRESRLAGKERQGSMPMSPRVRSMQSIATDAAEGGSSKAGNLAQSPPTLSSTAFPTGEQHEDDLFDYHATVIALTLQLLDEHEETRVSALEWLLMLHSKAPRKILVMDDGTFPALLKTLSDPSEEVIKGDVRLLAQISSSSDDTYFQAFMANLLSLFSTDRRLLETRGSLIVRQLCSSLHTERIFRTMAEILEKDEDLEFASIMVQTLNIILVTSPELADFRKRLRNLETKDGSALFVSLYRSWSHNAVATFSLCLLAQAYEHASNLLSIFADLEVTVPLLIQIDKLVQLLESPVFTSLRLQLLEPERYPYLFKCLYGLLMLLPQSSAFATLRNRLNAVSSLGFLQTVPRSSYSSSSTSTGGGASGAGAGAAGGAGAGGSSRSKMIGREGQSHVQWNELLLHFRSIQVRHERARRAALLAAQAAERAQSLGAGGGAFSLAGLGLNGGGPGGVGALTERLDGLGIGGSAMARGKSNSSAFPAASTVRSTSISPVRQIRGGASSAGASSWTDAQGFVHGTSAGEGDAGTVFAGAHSAEGAGRPLSPSVAGSASSRKTTLGRASSTRIV